MQARLQMIKTDMVQARPKATTGQAVKFKEVKYLISGAPRLIDGTYIYDLCSEEGSVMCPGVLEKDIEFEEQPSLPQAPPTPTSAPSFFRKALKFLYYNS
jgi:hypothetical protein